MLSISKSLLAWYAEAVRRHQRINRDGFNQKFADIISQNLYARLKNTELVSILSLATLCDARYKKQAFRSAGSASTAIGVLKAEMKKMTPETEDEDGADAPTPAQRRRVGASALWASFDTEVNYSDNNRSENLDTVADEVLKYLKMNNNPRAAGSLGVVGVRGQGDVSKHLRRCHEVSDPAGHECAFREGF